MNSRAGGAKDAEEEVFFPGRKAFLTWRDFAVSARGKEKIFSRKGRKGR